MGRETCLTKYGAYHNLETQDELQSHTNSKAFKNGPRKSMRDNRQHDIYMLKLNQVQLKNIL